VKILLVFGTRPEAIKMAPIIRAARKSPHLDVRVCVTGQHRELLDQVLNFFCICPDHDLSVMHHNQDLNSLTGRILTGLRPVLIAERPDLMLVQGDTISAFAASLAAFFEHIPVGHVEAGLRTNNLSSPFPEEAMRQMITRLAALHFAPTQANADTLLKEGVIPRSIHLTGNPGIDAVLWTRDKVRQSRIHPLSAYTSVSDLHRIEQSDHIVLVTAHRRENFGAGLRDLCDAVSQIAVSHPETAIVFPVHPNPNVRGPVHSALGCFRNVFLLPPLDYPAFVHLMDASSCIVTDSGGVQEEAPALGKPVIVTRANTERMESVSAGTSCLTGTVIRNIVTAADEILRLPKCPNIATPASSPFGDGFAAEKIVRILERQTFVEDRTTASLQALIGVLGLAAHPVMEGGHLSQHVSIQTELRD
jgi:UDP-N-acetylglucosamine 2-epimerase (non-hydrolysing)